MTGVQRWRKRPVEVEAAQLVVGNAADVAAWVRSHGGRADALDSGLLRLVTLEGMIGARPTDYVIRGVAGEFYPCRADVFEATYDLIELAEPVESTEAE